MRSRVSYITAAIVLLTCLVCPLVEVFDGWDHTIQTGNDTEYAVVILALCVGVAFSIAQCIVRGPLLRFTAELVSSSVRSASRSTSFSSTLVNPIATSPPATALRI
jgi:hypothetical protein